jgi:class 3 adenylate cyclase
MHFDFFKEAKIVYAIFGFCDIRNFTDVTEVLKEEVLIFVNTVAQIVHSEVSGSQGAANKNIGDAFLLVWKLKGNRQSNIKTVLDNSLDEQYKEQLMNASYNKVPQLFQGDFYNSKITEQALIAFFKITNRLQTQKDVEKYNQNKGLAKSIPNFKVAIGFGLHAGWAIEGPIGSEYKIDISYLSPNVNWAMRLEGLTKTYHKEFLFTDSIRNLVRSKFLKRIIRKID